MVKSTSSAYDTHINGEGLTTSTLVRVTRRDNLQFFMTDHDRDIEINVDDPADTDNAQVYDALTGFTRTAIRNTANLSVDNLDVETLLDNGGFLEADVRAGKWDFAEVEVFTVNWDDTSQGVMQTRRGFLGEISITDFTAKAELRGLVQLLSQVIGEVYTPNCRADHGDDRCTFDLSLTTETTEVEAVDADNITITVPDHFIDRNLFDTEPEFLFGQGVKIDDSEDPPLGRLTLLRRSSVEDGSFRNPYLVANATDVTNIRDDVLAWYALANNVDMTAFGLFTPIPGFQGGLDGRGFAIQNLDLNHSAVPLATAVALFEDTLNGAIIRRLFMEDVNVDNGAGGSAQYKAALVGSAASGSVIEDCYVETTTPSGIETDGDNAGGLVGIMAGSTLRRCWASIRITGTIGTNVGGLLGNNNGGNSFSLLRFDSDVATTSALGNGVVAADMDTFTTLEMYDRANWLEPAGDGPDGRSAILPDRAGNYDFLTVWVPPVILVDYPRLRQWF